MEKQMLAKHIQKIGKEKPRLSGFKDRRPNDITSENLNLMQDIKAKDTIIKLKNRELGEKTREIANLSHELESASRRIQEISDLSEARSEGQMSEIRGLGEENRTANQRISELETLAKRLAEELDRAREGSGIVELERKAAESEQRNRELEAMLEDSRRMAGEMEKQCDALKGRMLGLLGDIHGALNWTNGKAKKVWSRYTEGCWDDAQEKDNVNGVE